ncbi:hypothetical protein ACA910_009217 [Epithemia clementina (nom. ined.)]
MKESFVHWRKPRRRYHTNDGLLRTRDFWVCMITFLVLLNRSNLSSTSAFLVVTPQPPPSSASTETRIGRVRLLSNIPGAAFRTKPKLLLLWAVKKKKSSKGDGGGGRTGGGFGVSSSSSFSSSSSASSSPPTATTAISGHSGSGVKALRKAANTFDRIRKENKNIDDLQKLCRDVYVRSPLNSPTTFWFVGKIARQGTPPSSLSSSLSSSSSNSNHTSAAPTSNNMTDHEYFCQAAVAQKRLILEYAKDQLRPQNMGGKYASTLELWLAPGDSEMDVATNKVNLTQVAGSVATFFPNDEIGQNESIRREPFVVGYNPEIYVGEEITKGGLRVQRNERGETIKPAYDVNQAMPEKGG